MKKSILLLAVLGITISANAQLTQGSIYLGLSLGFSSGKQTYESKTGSTTFKEEPGKSSSWNLKPEVNYFLRDHLSVGANIGIMGSMTETTNTNGNIRNTYTNELSGFGFGIFVRNYWQIQETFHVFGGLGINLDNQNGTSTVRSTNLNTNTTVETKSKMEVRAMNVGLNGGFAWNATPRFLIMGSWAFLGFTSQSQKTNIMENGDYDLAKSSGFVFDFNSFTQSFNLGFAYRINNP